MTRSAYEVAVAKVLAQFTDHATQNLRAVFSKLPEKTTGVELEICVDQDGEGFLNVQVSLNGPDLYILNRTISEYALLFGTHMTEKGLSSGLPLMDPWNEEFEVSDALTDCAADWLVQVWKRTGITLLEIPVTIQSHDQYGDRAPIELN